MPDQRRARGGAEVQLDDGKIYVCQSCGYEFEGAVSAVGGLDCVATSYVNVRRKRKHVCRSACREYETRAINRESVYCMCGKYMRLGDTTKCPFCGNARIRRKNRRCGKGSRSQGTDPQGRARKAGGAVPEGRAFQAVPCRLCPSQREARWED